MLRLPDSGRVATTMSIRDQTKLGTYILQLEGYFYSSQRSSVSVRSLWFWSLSLQKRTDQKWILPKVQIQEIYYASELVMLFMS